MKILVLAAAVPLLMLAACGEEAAEAPATEASPAADLSPPLPPGEEMGGEDGGEGADDATLAALDGATARCHTEPFDSDIEYDGPCKYEALGGGSFVVTPPAGQTFSDDATEFVIEVDAPGVAGMSMRVDGELNFLGTANKEGACWNSETYQVCVYE